MMRPASTPLRSRAWQGPAWFPRAGIVLLALAGCLAWHEPARAATDGREQPGACALIHADSAYRAAELSAVAQDFTGALVAVSSHVAEAKRCINSATQARPSPEVAGALAQLADNLDRLDGLLSTISAIVHRASGLGRVNMDNILAMVNARDPGLAQYPIAQVAVRGSALSVALLSDSVSVAVRDDVLRTHWDLRSSLLRDEYGVIRMALKDLYARQPWRLAAAVSAYEGNVFGMGGVLRHWRFGREILVTPSLLADAGAGAGWGVELSAGVLAGDVALLPGVVYLDSEGEKLGVIGTILLVRPGGLGMGISVSSTRGIGFKTVIGF